MNYCCNRNCYFGGLNEQYNFIYVAASGAALITVPKAGDRYIPGASQEITQIKYQSRP